MNREIVLLCIYVAIGIVVFPIVYIKTELPLKKEITLADFLLWPLGIIIWPGILFFYGLLALDKIVLFKR